MANFPIHWAEGLFLLPQHLQAAERSLREEVSLSGNMSQGYRYGFHQIQIDAEALNNWQLKINVCHALLRDGTLLRFPESASLSPSEIPREAFESPEDRVLVHIAVPALQLGKQNAQSSADSPTIRYVVESMEVEDENEIGRPQDVLIRKHNVRIFIGDKDLAGYEALPVLRLKLGATAEAPPEIDPEYIPPLLCCDAWSELQEEIIEKIYRRLGAATDRHTRTMQDNLVRFDSGNPNDIESLFKQNAFNGALGAVSQLPFVRGVHPLDAYRTLCFAASLFSVFRRDRRFPELPRYDHDDLGKCFRAVMRLFDFEDRPSYIKRDFVVAGAQLKVRLESEWLEPKWKLFIGIQSQLTIDKLDSLLNKGLEMKIGASEDVDAIYIDHKAGVAIEVVRMPPRELPAGNWSYWVIDRSVHQWDNVANTLNLGIRMNENHIQGMIDDRIMVSLRYEGNKFTPIQFALFALPVE